MNMNVFTLSGFHCMTVFRSSGLEERYELIPKTLQITKILKNQQKGKYMQYIDIATLYFNLF